MPKLALHDEHLRAGAKIVFWGGFQMPQEYSGLVAEHFAVREKVGVFDVSHMGRFRIEGKDALKFIDRLVTNDVVNIPPKKAVYAIFCDEKGYPIDDLFVYVEQPQSILLVVNATNTPKDLAWLKDHQKGYQVTITDVTATTNQLALQGPAAESVLEGILKTSFKDLKFMFYTYASYEKETLLISRSGYTGSDGFEIYGTPKAILVLWKALLEKGVVPCGLGARDTLRFEAALPLYSHELSEHITPVEAGLTFAIKTNKNFIGRDALKLQIEKGTAQKLVGLELIGRGVARAEYEVMANGKKIGVVTTGYLLPKRTSGLAMAILESNYAKPGTKVTVMMRTTPIEAVVRDMIFMQKQYKR